MAELHPFFVHFPIALLLVALVFDLWGAFKKQTSPIKTAYSLQLTAAISALMAAISGNQAQNLIVKQAELLGSVSESLEAHTSLGNIAVWVIIIAALIRTFVMLEQKTWTPKVWVFVSMSLALAVLVLFTGFFGGELTHEILQYFILN